MRINDKEFSQFRASVVSFDIKTLQIENNIFISETSLLPILGEQILAAQERELVLDFINEDDISDFTAICNKECILDINDGYLYRCFLNSQPDIKVDGYHAYTVSYPFYVIKQKEKTILKDKVLGNVTCECIYEITSPKDIDSFTIDGYVIKDLKMNRTFIIDGINKLIYYTDEPNYSELDRTNLLKFPKLKVGPYIMEKTDEDVDVVISYYPTYF